MKELTHQVQRVLDKIVDFPLKTMENKIVELKKKKKNRNLIYQEFHIQQICPLKM